MEHCQRINRSHIYHTVKKIHNMQLTNIIDLDSIEYYDISNLSLIYDSVYDPASFILDHIFSNNTSIIDCIKWYNRIWSIRQNVNLHLANVESTARSFTISFSDIHYSFIDTKKAKQKEFLVNTVPFIRYVRRIGNDILCTFDDTVFRFVVDYRILYEVPVTSGVINKLVSDIDFAKFVCFLIGYGMQSLLIVTKHFKFREQNLRLKEYNCQFNIHFSNYVRSSGNFVLDKKYIHDMIVPLDIGANYKKFFEG